MLKIVKKLASNKACISNGTPETLWKILQIAILKKLKDLFFCDCSKKDVFNKCLQEKKFLVPLKKVETIPVSKKLDNTSKEIYSLISTLSNFT